MPHTSQGFLARARLYLVGIGAIYAGAVFLLGIPYFQSHTVYLNAIKLPWFANFDAPEKYGLAPNKTLNFKLNTADNETLGAWFILSDSYYHSLPSLPSPVSAHVEIALRKRPTILFLHGNAATRAFKARILHYEALSARLQANVLAIDYRGFADSTGTPSEEGLVKDARAAWDWLVSRGARPEDILVMGHSLGTGVSAQLGAELSRDGIRPKGVVLLSPFSSIRELLNTYHIFGLVPLMRPLAMIPYMTNVVTWALIHKFDTLRAVPNITADVVIAHAQNDWDIPYTHSEVLFNAFLAPYLPQVDSPMNPMSIKKDEWARISEQQRVRSVKHDALVTRTELPHFGSVEKFEADGRKVILVKALAGGHDYLGVQEGVQDAIGRALGFF
ncbi:Alpha/Beta hydrolase protein [Crucibulum laeve]|uniref:Alpha/Beta hydrolase protein n=1 Tax=Crucibulum laeve TaxID=68775 RepID=A0A5C3M7Q6_9AGAR|nr:Alpha/Beta hydrolase protein [Crucibulum laeve]